MDKKLRVIETKKTFEEQDYDINISNLLKNLDIEITTKLKG